MTLFFDSSALVKRYVDEPGTPEVVSLLRRGSTAICRLTVVEIASAICRRAREGQVDPSTRERLLSGLEDDVTLCRVVEIVPDVVSEATSLLRRYPLRAADSVQLASCLLLRRELARAPRLVTYDGRLASAAEAEGIEVLPSQQRRSS